MTDNAEILARHIEACIKAGKWRIALIYHRDLSHQWRDDEQRDVARQLMAMDYTVASNGPQLEMMSGNGRAVVLFAPVTSDRNLCGKRFDAIICTSGCQFSIGDILLTRCTPEAVVVNNFDEPGVMRNLQVVVREQVAAQAVG